MYEYHSMMLMKIKGKSLNSQRKKTHQGRSMIGMMADLLSETLTESKNNFE